MKDRIPATGVSAGSNGPGAIPKRRALRAAALVFVAVLSVVTACAYYNMLYNAKAKYGEAEKMPREKDGAVSRTQKSKYDEVIQKCTVMIETYPKSRWVDDAMLLIARARYGKDDFGGAINKINELEDTFPESNLLEKARFLKGRSYADWGKHEEAVEVLSNFTELYPKSDWLDQVLYLAGRSALVLGDEERAMGYLDFLGRKFPKSIYKLNADIEMAEIFASQKKYDRSIEIYERLSKGRLAVANRYRVWSGEAFVYKELERYQEALDVLMEVNKLIFDTSDPEDKASTMLLTGESYVGLDSLDRAVNVYKDVTARFGKSKYSAEAQYRIGLIYQERMDSVDVAKTYFDEVPRQYAGSDFAGDAIRRSSSISTLIKLRDSSGEDDPQAMALRQFSLAEVQMFQFENAKKALVEYRKLLDEFPDSEFAPRAAYAVGYIYAIVMRDSLKAYESYRYLLDNYPDSQQALNAGMFYASAAADSARDEAGAADKNKSNQEE